jgi:hypothetical protein
LKLFRNLSMATLNVADFLSWCKATTFIWIKKVKGWDNLFTALEVCTNLPTGQKLIQTVSKFRLNLFFQTHPILLWRKRKNKEGRKEGRKEGSKEGRKGVKRTYRNYNPWRSRYEIFTCFAAVSVIATLMSQCAVENCSRSRWAQCVAFRCSHFNLETRSLCCFIVAYLLSFSLVSYSCQFPNACWLHSVHESKITARPVPGLFDTADGWQGGGGLLSSLLWAEALRMHTQKLSACFKNVHSDRIYDCTPSRMKCFGKKCNAPWPFRSELSSDHTVPTAAVYSIENLR